MPEDEKDNENPGTEKVFVMFVLDFMVFQYSFQNSIDQLKVWHVHIFIQIKKVVYYFKIDLNIPVFKVMVLWKLYGTRKRAKKEKEKKNIGFFSQASVLKSFR